LKSFNFDVITAIDMQKLHKKLEKLVKSGKYEYIIIDGILLFEDEKLLKILDKKYFVDLDKEECYRRRQLRNYKSKDTEGYFDFCVYPEFQKYKFKCESTLKNVIYLNGSDSADYNFNYVLNDLKHF
jgi:uridine kinase